MMFKVLLIAFVLIILAVAGLGLSVLINRLHFFRHSHIESNPHLRKNGILCVKQEEMLCYKKSQGCAGCKFYQTE